MSNFSIADIDTLNSEALASGESATWIFLRDIRFSRDVEAQASENAAVRKARSSSHANSPKGILTDDQIITDYWIKVLQQKGVGLPASEEVVRDVINLSLMFDSSYPLSMLALSVGSLVRSSEKKDQLLNEIFAARAAAAPDLKASWDSLILDCLDS